jgi:hypothetical protein
MIRLLRGLDQLKDSDGDIQVVIEPEEITIVTDIDEFTIRLLEDAVALRDALDSWIEKKLAQIKEGPDVC